MASRRKSKRRLEELQEPQGDVRRSPRLRERYSRERSEGPALLTVTQSVTSRPALSGYMKELEQQNASILNESGQSVPAYFDLGQDDTGSRHSGDSREEIDAVSGQPFGTPDPQHLYGTKCVLLHIVCSYSCSLYRDDNGCVAFGIVLCTAQLGS
ncbi:hypothetical protein GBAR_LOCUS51 [Geodia barretti]|uniref:Uncharacterized protein n=1 Tax=Geodia barretti TaxID=519541 RepID=A0AA35QRQ2_GEOBA|nr:hypothetical protein GBAR_LOCUS51 [Geodia barretti]